MVKNQNPNSQTQCAVTNLKADCVSRNLDSIPQYLDVKITDLDVSRNPIKRLTDDDFKRYKSLLTLRLRGLNPSTGNKSISFSVNTFTPLVELITLDMSDSPLDLESHESEGLTFNWPNKIKFLSMAHFTPHYFTNKNLNLSGLPYLGELNVSHHNLEMFPELHPLAPIYWIDLYSNPLKELTAESLAPFCTLAFLRLGHTQSQGLESIEKEVACRCHRVEQWMVMSHIRGFEITCSTADDNTCPNKKNFSNVMMSQRKTCLDRQPTSGLWKWLILFALISLLLPAAYVGNEYYKWRKMMNGTDDSSSASPATENGAAAEGASPERDDTPTSNPES